LKFGLKQAVYFAAKLGAMLARNFNRAARIRIRCATQPADEHCLRTREILLDELLRVAGVIR
jgi:hypothetical protein